MHLQAKVDIAPIGFGTTDFFADGLTATGGQDAKFSSLKVENVRGDFHLPSIWHLLFGDRKFEVNNVEVQRIKASFFPERAPLTFPKPAQREKVTSVRCINVRELRVAWDGGSIERLGVTGEPVERGWRVTGGGGRIEQRSFPPLDITSVRLLHKEPSLFIQEGRLRMEGGDITVTGEMTEDERLDLQFAVTGVVVTPLLPEDWRARLHGRLHGDARVRVPLREGVPRKPAVTGQAELREAILEGLPVLDKIAEFTRTDRFRRLALTQVRGSYVWENSQLRVTDLIVESDRLISVRGRFTVIDGEIDGTFDVGITPGPLQWLPGSQEKVFTTMRAGYAWTTLRIKGPYRSPGEDLTSRLVAAAQGAVVEKAAGVAGQAVGTATEAVGGAVDTVRKGASGVMNLLFGN